MDFTKLSFTEAPLIKTTPPGPKSKEFLDFQSSYESSAVTYPKELPMAIRRAKGATVEDVDGNVYIDFFGGAGVMNVGHSNPQVIDAALRQISELTHSLDVPNPARKSLVESLLALLPSSLNKLFFGGPTGSDAVEAAVKLARYNKKRHPMIAFEGSYHGMTSGALSLSSGLGFKEDFLPLISEVHFVPYAYCYRCAFGKKSDSCDQDCAKYLEHVLEDPHSGVGKPSAVIVEAVQGEGGTIVPPDDFITKIREICSKYEVLLIVDEIQAGFCRTGKMFAFEHADIVPDMVTMSKALGGVGFPISCVAFKEELDTWPPGKHIGTFRGNVVAYAAGHAALKFMVENRLADHASKVGDTLLTHLKEIEKDSEIVGEARGKGLMLGIEFVHDKVSKDPAPEFAQKVRTLCHRRGLLIEVGGHYNNVARFLPPLILTEDLAIKGMEIFAEVVRAVEKSR
ncbi:MAG: aspartate aminotransferase family protein [Candidatus Aminicenantes bacterium]|nr:aspartate aminotransferase family protein [Candidatus Aminicenantes bacterium]MDH5384901.1 aspartate aminotransferase family protein [Candidatus Aminicenantes bacterium]